MRLHPLASCRRGRWNMCAVTSTSFVLRTFASRPWSMAGCGLLRLDSSPLQPGRDPKCTSSRTNNGLVWRNQTTQSHAHSQFLVDHLLLPFAFLYNAQLVQHDMSTYLLVYQTISFPARWNSHQFATIQTYVRNHSIKGSRSRAPTKHFSNLATLWHVNEFCKKWCPGS